MLLLVMVWRLKLWKFKIIKIKKYNKLSKYDRNYIIIIDLESVEVEVEKIDL